MSCYKGPGMQKCMITAAGETVCDTVTDGVSYILGQMPPCNSCNKPAVVEKFQNNNSLSSMMQNVFGKHGKKEGFVGGNVVYQEAKPNPYAYAPSFVPGAFEAFENGDVNYAQFEQFGAQPSDNNVLARYRITQEMQAPKMYNATTSELENFKVAHKKKM